MVHRLTITVFANTVHMQSFYAWFYVNIAFWPLINRLI